VSVGGKSPRGPFSSALGETRAKRKGAGWYATLILSAGALSGIAALLGVSPFGGLQVFVTNATHRDTLPSPIAARNLFPPVGPVHKVIDIYDPAPPAAPLAAQPGSAHGNFPLINFPQGPMSAIEATCEAAKQAAEGKSEAYKQNVELQCEAAKQAYERSHP
jgi:hypothetical protein